MGAKRLLALLAVGAAVSLALVAVPELTATLAAPPPDVNPHGGYSSDTTLCEVCHDPHEAQGPTLGVLPTQREACYLCHDGGIATTDVRGDFGEAEIGISTRVSSHPVAAERNGVQLTCGDCHAPHQDPAQVTQLLAVRSGETLIYSSPGSPIGNAFCYACHGVGSDLPAPFGDHSGFESSVHNTDPDIAAPASGTQIKCLACHDAHASDFRRLTTDDQERSCFSCHTFADPNTSGGSNPKHAFSSTPNDYSTADGTPVRVYHHPVDQAEQEGATRVVECASCHNPHLADRTSGAGETKVVDPADTSARFLLHWPGADMNRGNIADFCTTCHVSPATTQPVPDGETVPYGIRLVNDTADDADGTPHDQFDAAEWYGSADHGPTGANLACTACHDVHGSTNAWMLRESVVSIDGSVTTSITGFGALESEWETLQSMCLTCHQSRGTGHGAGRLCTRCHSHTSGRL